jgi:glycosyltransferase involved in cell wall biosynthesis
MRILFFTNEYSHPNLPNSGGVGSFLKIMSESLSQQGHEIFVYGFSKKPIEFEDKSIRFKFIKKYSKQFRFNEFKRSLSSKLGYKKADLNFLIKERKYYAKKLKTHCIKNNIDIIESFVFNGYTAFWDNSTPLVLRFHGSRGFWHYYLGAKKDEFKIKMEKTALISTPYTVANSFFSKEFIEDYYDIHVDEVIPNGISIDHFSPDNTIKVKKNSIFYVGTISEAKGVDNVAKVFNEVIKKNTDATLHLIGRGDKYFNYLKETILSKEAKKNTNYYNHIPLSELPKKIAEASVVVVPSKGETFGFTIIEAMASEKVTIVSNIPVAHEIVEHTTDGFIAKNNEEFTSIINKIFENPKSFNELRKRARQKVIKKYTLELMTSNSLEYYKKILNKK